MPNEINHELIDQIYNSLNVCASKEAKKTARENATAMMGKSEKVTPIEKYRNQMTNFAGTCLYFLIAQQENQKEIIKQNQRIIELLEGRKIE